MGTKKVINEIYTKERFIEINSRSISNGKWYGIGKEDNVKGTHETYNIFYNGSCVREYFDTQEEATLATMAAYRKLSIKQPR